MNYKTRIKQIKTKALWMPKKYQVIDMKKEHFVFIDKKYIDYTKEMRDIISNMAASVIPTIDRVIKTYGLGMKNVDESFLEDSSYTTFSSPNYNVSVKREFYEGTNIISSETELESYGKNLDIKFKEYFFKEDNGTGEVYYARVIKEGTVNPETKESTIKDISVWQFYFDEFNRVAKIFKMTFNGKIEDSMMKTISYLTIKYDQNGCGHFSYVTEKNFDTGDSRTYLISHFDKYIYLITRYESKNSAPETSETYFMLIDPKYGSTIMDKFLDIYPVDKAIHYIHGKDSEERCTFIHKKSDGFVIDRYISYAGYNSDDEDYVLITKKKRTKQTKIKE